MAVFRPPKVSATCHINFAELGIQLIMTAENHDDFMKLIELYHDIAENNGHVEIRKMEYQLIIYLKEWGN